MLHTDCITDPEASQSTSTHATSEDTNANQSNGDLNRGTTNRPGSQLGQKEVPRGVNPVAPSHAWPRRTGTVRGPPACRDARHPTVAAGRPPRQGSVTATPALPRSCCNREASVC